MDTIIHESHYLNDQKKKFFFFVNEKLSGLAQSHPQRKREGNKHSQKRNNITWFCLESQMPTPREREQFPLY